MNILRVCGVNILLFVVNYGVCAGAADETIEPETMSISAHTLETMKLKVWVVYPASVDNEVAVDGLVNLRANTKVITDGTGRARVKFVWSSGAGPAAVCVQSGVVDDSRSGTIVLPPEPRTIMKIQSRTHVSCDVHDMLELDTFSVVGFGRIRLKGTVVYLRVHDGFLRVAVYEGSATFEDTEGILSEAIGSEQVQKMGISEGVEIGSGCVFVLQSDGIGSRIELGVPSEADRIALTDVGFEIPPGEVFECSAPASFGVSEDASEIRRGAE